MRKKGKKQTQEALEPKQRNVTLEIDYDKLAKAIVRAQSEVSQRQKQQHKRKTRFRNALLGFLNGMVYHGVSVVCVLFIIGVWRSYFREQAFSLLIPIVLSVLFLIVGAISFMCGQETLDDDYDTTLPLLNLNVSLIAMVVALISLFHVMH